MLILAGVAAGCIVGYVCYLIATFFTDILREAFPNMTAAWYYGVWIVTLSFPVLALRTVAVQGKGIGARPFAFTAIAVIVAFLIADASGVGRVFPGGARFSLHVGSVPVGRDTRQFSRS